MGAVQIEIGEDNGEIALEQCFSEIFNLQAFPHKFLSIYKVKKEN